MRRFIFERTRWGWHVRIWISNEIHAAWSQTFGWHIRVGRFVRARTWA